MEMVLKKENYSGYESVWSGIAAKEFGADCVIPDSMPDVCSVVEGEGTILLRNRSLEEGRVRLEATVSAVVLYLPEGESPLKNLPVTIPVQFDLEAPGVSGADETLRSVLRLRLRALDAQLINSRKIALRADVEAEAQCFRRNEIAIAYDLAGGQTPAHLRTDSVTVEDVCDIREKIFVITDSYALPAGRAVERILSHRVEVCPEDSKFVSGKIVFRGRVKSQILFGDGNGEPLCSELFETEFSQIMEAEGEGEVQTEVQLALTGIYFDMPDPTDAQGKLSAEIHMAAQGISRQTTEMHYISDAYSNCSHLLPTMESMEILTRARPLCMRQTVAGKVEPVPEGEVLSVSGTVGAVSRGDGCIRTAVNIRILSRSAAGQYAISRCRLNVEFTLDAPESSMLSSVCVKVCDVYYSAGSGPNVRATLQLDGIVLEKKTLTCVGAIEEDEEDVRDYDSYPSVTLVRTGADRDFWALAKKYHSTVEAISEANREKEAGLLLIPKTR